MRRRAAGALGKRDVGQRVTLKGWVDSRRDHGGLVFLNLRDRSGVVQAVVRPEDAPEAAEALERARLEWVVEVSGLVSRREPAAVNPEMSTGAIEVVVEAGSILAEAHDLPFTFDERTRASEELRLQHRYLDLRRPELQRNLILRHKAVLETLNYCDEEGFLHLESPILTRSTPEGARDYLVPSREHKGEFYALPQSPQLFKQLFMISGLERYVQIARCFRDEDLRSERQPEFTQIDLELSFTEEEEVFTVVEGLLRRLFGLVQIEVPDPVPRMTWDEAMRRFGSDRPDLRFEMEIRDLTEVVAESGFRVFSRAAAEGGVVRGVCLPEALGASRSQLDGWSDVAQQHGLPGVLALRGEDDGAAFQVKDALTSAECSAMAERLGLRSGDLALLAAGPERTVARGLGAVRVQAARDLERIPDGRHEFVWVTEFPLLEWDQEEERWQAANHPFTAPDPRDLELLEAEPERARSRGYDIVLNGVELGGGSIRIHEPELQSRVFELLGIGAEEARERFGFLLDALRCGAPPHGGIALGLDRLVMLMAGTESIREVIAYPKTTSATDLMTGAPTPVEPETLHELGLAVVAGGADDPTSD